MLYTVFLAVCLSTIPKTDCNRHTATAWTVAPEQAHGLGRCAQLGEQYIADTALVPDGTYLKVFCRPVEAQKENVG